MMPNNQINKRILYYLLVSFGIFTVIIRYPFSSHEIGMDGYLYHAMTTMLNYNGYAPWILNPLSYWGLYPFSDSSACPFLTGMISKVLNIDIESAVFIFSLFFGFLLFFIPVLIGIKYKRDIISSIFLGTIVSISPILFFSTQWELSERAPVVCFFAYVILLLMMIARNEKESKNKLILILILILFTSTTIHKISFFILPIIIVFIILYLPRHLFRNNFSLMPKYKSITLWIAFIISSFIIMFLLGHTSKNQLFNISNYSKGAFFNMSTFMGEIINLGITTIGGTGILLVIFGILGFFSVINKRIKNTIDYFLLISLIAIIPLIPIRTYMRPVLPLILSIFIFIGFIYTIQQIKFIKSNILPFFIISILIATSFSIGMNYYWNSQRVGLGVAIPSEGTYNLAIYLKSEDNTKFSFTSTNGMTGVRIEAFSNIPFSPQPESTIWYGYLSINNITIVRSNNFNELEFYKFTSMLALEQEWYTLFCNSVSSNQVKDILTKYQIKYVIEDNSFKGQTSGNPIIPLFESEFLYSINISQYKIYVDNSNTVSYINP